MPQLKYITPIPKLIERTISQINYHLTSPKHRSLPISPIVDPNIASGFRIGWGVYKADGAGFQTLLEPLGLSTLSKQHQVISSEARNYAGNSITIFLHTVAVNLWNFYFIMSEALALSLWSVLLTIVGLTACVYILCFSASHFICFFFPFFLTSLWIFSYWNSLTAFFLEVSSQQNLLL